MSTSIVALPFHLMQTAIWITAASTAVLALTSMVAVLTWRENRRRQYEEQLVTRILEAGRKEFSTKDELASDKENLASFKSGLVGWGLLAAIFAVIGVWDRIFPPKDKIAG